MNGVREWSAMICLAGLVAALVQGLIPNGSMERIAKFILGAFIICVLIGPLTSAIPKISLSMGSSASAQRNQKLDSALDSQARGAAEKSIENLVVSELNRIQVKCKNVRVDMDTNKDGSIQITKIIVTLDKKYAAEQAKTSDWLEKELGIQTEVVTDGS